MSLDALLNEASSVVVMSFDGPDAFEHLSLLERVYMTSDPESSANSSGPRLTRQPLLTICVSLVGWLAIGSSFAGPQKQQQTQSPTDKMCKQVAEALEHDRSPTGSKPLFVDSIDLGGRTWRYQGIDLDRDNKPDDVIQSCGSPSDGSCTLRVNLSKGGSYEFAEEIFKVIRFRSRYYVVVGDSFPPDRTGSRRLYALGERSADLVCKTL